MHVNARIHTRWSFREVRRAALALSREIERRVPQLASSKWWKEERHGVFIDHNKNAKDRTTCLAYSVRPLPDARVFSRRGDWPPDVDDADLVVNATPVTEAVVLRVGAGQTLVDLPYPASATAAAARELGATVLDGLDVLVAQGAASFERWTGLPAPVDVMRAAVRSPA